MQKDKDIGIYILTHKSTDYGLIDDSYHTPLQCGKALNSSSVCGIGDDNGDNISTKNPWFLEATGIYWIWKNCHKKYKGQFQYRRWLDFDKSMVPALLSELDIICGFPFISNVTVGNFYGQYHITSDLDLCFEIIKEKYPEYVPAFNEYILNSNVLFYSNGFITTREKYDGLCSFVFDVLFEFEKRMNLHTKEEWIEHGKLAKHTTNLHKEITDAEYQSRVCGALSERLVTLYIRKNFQKIGAIDYTLKEEGQMI